MSQHNSGFFKGFMIGAAVGAAVALFMAPKTGEEMRKELQTKSTELKEKAEARYTEAQEKAESTIAKLQARVDDLSSQVDEAIIKVRKILSQEVEELAEEVAPEQGVQTEAS